ncbi:MAG: hypothetical protein U1F68_19630 [Gammaproteobacteria bacterium]
MIKDQDVHFHAPEAAVSNWAETNFFGFYNADAKLNIGVYALFRTNLGIVSSTICMNSGFANVPWEADFCDLRASMPIPEPRDLSHFRLENGLSIRCLRPNMDWHIGYDDGEGTLIDVEYRAIMLPFDIHDPAMDPMKAKALAAAEQGGKFAWGTAYNGHFDQSGHFQGRVAIRGREIPVDCISTMDHSWGPRPERGAPNMSWLHAHFSKDLAFHVIFSFDPKTNGRELALAHGYVVEKGEIFGLKAGKGITQRTRERHADTAELVLVDKADREWQLSAKGMTTFPWQCWPNMVSFNVLAEWHCANLTGYGEIQDFFEMPQLTALNADPTTRKLARGAG